MEQKGRKFEQMTNGHKNTGERNTCDAVTKPHPSSKRASALGFLFACCLNFSFCCKCVRTLTEKQSHVFENSSAIQDNMAFS